MRTAAFMLTWPVLSGSLIPRNIQILASIALSLLIYPTISWQSLAPHLLTESLVFLVIREVFIGLSLGFVSRFFLFAVSICGEIVSITMGLSGAQIFNPASNSRSTVLEQFQVMLASLFFLAINGHHMFMAAFVKTYEILPLSLEALNLVGLRKIDVLVQEIMIAGVKMSAPVLAAIFLMNVTMGIIGRAVPQVNVLITSLPANILVGLGILFLSIPVFVTGLDEYVQVAIERAFQLVKSY